MSNPEAERDFTCLETLFISIKKWCLSPAISSKCQPAAGGPAVQLSRANIHCTSNQEQDGVGVRQWTWWVQKPLNTRLKIKGFVWATSVFQVLTYLRTSRFDDTCDQTQMAAVFCQESFKFREVKASNCWRGRNKFSIRRGELASCSKMQVTLITVQT